MSAITLETVLARLYTDATLRREFLAEPGRVAQDAGLSAADIEALVQIDRAGLLMAADSYAWKRTRHGKAKKSLATALMGWLMKKVKP